MEKEVTFLNKGNNPSNSIELTDVTNDNRLTKEPSTVEEVLAAIEEAKINRRDNLIFLLQETLNNEEEIVSLVCSNELHERQIIALQSNVDGKFCVLWRAKNESFALCVKNESIGREKLLKIFPFVTRFIENCLADDHSAVAMDNKVNRLSIPITSLANTQGFNLLFHATLNNELKIVKILLRVPFSVDTMNDRMLPAHHACMSDHFDVLLVLLEANSMIPVGFDGANCVHVGVRRFVQMCEKFHADIKDENINSIQGTIARHPNLRYFYNSEGSSASAAAIKLRKFDVYEVLLESNLFLSSFEDIDEITSNFSLGEKKKLREIHFKNKKDMQEPHLSVLMSRSYVGHDNHNVTEKLSHVARAFSVLNSFVFVKILLQIAAMLSNFHIVFDFNRDSVEFLDPTQDRWTMGVFHASGRIYVGARQLLDSATEHEVFATIAHEICHFVLFNFFGENARPYIECDLKAKNAFEAILSECEKKKEIDVIIGHVFGYDAEQQHAELIVRIPHFLAHYHGQPAMLETRKRDFVSLFHFYEMRVMPQLETFLSGLKKRAEKEKRAKDKKISMLKKVLIATSVILSLIALLVGILMYSPTYKWRDLSETQKEKAFDGTVRFVGRELKFCQIYGRNESFGGIFDALSSEKIKKLLKNETLDLTELQNQALQSHITLTFNELTSELKEVVYKSFIRFQGQQISMFELLTNDSEIFLSHLDANETLKLLQNKSDISIGREPHEDMEIFIPRGFIDSNFDIDNKTWDEKQQKYVFSFSDDEIRSFSKSAETILEESATFFLLSDDAGTGKTTVFKNLVWKAKKKHPLNWIEYVDLKAHMDVYRKKLTLVEALKEIFTLATHEIEVFESLFRNNRVVIFWDGFDEISPTFSKLVLNYMQIIHEKSENVQFLSTRRQYERLLSDTFKCNAYQLLPYLKAENEMFLEKFYTLRNVTGEKRIQSRKNVERLVARIQRKENIYEPAKDYVGSPLLLSMIAQVSIEKESALDVTNLYTIYESFLRTQVNISTYKGDLGRDERSGLLVDTKSTVSVEVFQYHALKLLHGWKRKDPLPDLYIMRKYKNHKFDTKDLSRYGILIFDSKSTANFVHRTFGEFFVAQYLVTNVYEMDDEPKETEILARLELMAHFATGRYSGKVIEFLDCYRNATQLKTLNSDILQVFDVKLKDIFYQCFKYDFTIQMLKIACFNNIIEVFLLKKERVRRMWHLSEETTIFYWWAYTYTEYFCENFGKIERMALRVIKNSSRVIGKLFFGRNQRGNILFLIHLELLFEPSDKTSELLSLSGIKVDFDFDLFRACLNITQFFSFVKLHLTPIEIHTLLRTNFEHFIRNGKHEILLEMRTIFSHDEMREFIFTRSRFGYSSLFLIEDFNITMELLEEVKEVSNETYLGLICFEHQGYFLLSFNEKEIIRGSNLRKAWKKIAERANDTIQRKILRSRLNGEFRHNTIFTASVEFAGLEVYEYVSGIYRRLFNDSEMREFCHKFFSLLTMTPHIFSPFNDAAKAFVNDLRTLFTLDEIRNQFEIPLKKVKETDGKLTDLQSKFVELLEELK